MVFARPDQLLIKFHTVDSKDNSPQWKRRSQTCKCVIKTDNQDVNLKGCFYTLTIPVFKAQSAQGAIIAEWIPPQRTPKSIYLLNELKSYVFEGFIVGVI